MTNSTQYQAELAQDRFGLQIAARLTDVVDDLPHDISERLRASRVQALSHRKVASTRRATTYTIVNRGSTLIFGDDGPSWWDRLVATVPLLALIFGLIAITFIQDDNRANEIAEIDTELLVDDLPPIAYADVGFAQFLKLKVKQHQEVGQDGEAARF